MYFCYDYSLDLIKEAVFMCHIISIELLFYKSNYYLQLYITVLVIDMHNKVTAIICCICALSIPNS